MSGAHEFTVGDVAYRCRKLDVFRQLHVGRRIAPLTAQGMLVAQFRAMGAEHREADVLAPVLQAFAAMPDTEIDYVIGECLSVVERRQVTDGHASWSPVQAASRTLSFADIQLPQLLQITFHVLRHNFADFMGGLALN